MGTKLCSGKCYKDETIKYDFAKLCESIEASYYSNKINLSVWCLFKKYFFVFIKRHFLLFSIILKIS
jgi:hypothetical protein